MSRILCYGSSANDSVCHMFAARTQPAIGKVMRELDDEEQELLVQLNAGLPTDELIAMVRDLAEVLTKEGLVVRARVAETAADRLEQLSPARVN